MVRKLKNTHLKHSMAAWRRPRSSSVIDALASLSSIAGESVARSIPVKDVTSAGSRKLRVVQVQDRS